MRDYVYTHIDEPENTGDYFAYNYKDMIMAKLIKAKDLVAGDTYNGWSIVLVRPRGLKVKLYFYQHDPVLLDNDQDVEQ